MTSQAARGLLAPQPILPLGVFDEPREVEDILASIGLSAADLEEAALVGIRAYLECTPHDPAHLPGVVLSGKAFRGLCDILIPVGWERVDRRGHSTAVNTRGTIAITTALGNHNTGILRPAPRTVASKGLETELFIDRTQSSFFLDDPKFALRTAPPHRSTGLVLLLHMFESERRVNLELSVPKRTNRSRQISEWFTRLILPSIPFDVSVAPLSRIGDPPATAPQPRVSVQRKSP